LGFQTRIVLSAPPESSVSPSASQVKETIFPACPDNVCLSRRPGRPQRRTRVSVPPAAKVLLSGDQASARTWPS
jgi:hypothetical protein